LPYWRLSWAFLIFTVAGNRLLVIKLRNYYRFHLYPLVRVHPLLFLSFALLIFPPVHYLQHMRIQEALQSS
jgi:hypothetical protein